MTRRMSIAGVIKTRLAPRLHELAKIAFSRYLLCTNVVISASLSGLGDIMEQRIEILTGELNRWDPRRTRKMTATGVSVGVVCHFWYGFLDSRIVGRTLKDVAKKTVVDQLIGSPLNLAVFFATLTLLEGQSLKELGTVKDKAIRLYIAEWVIWPPAQFVNFYFLPTRFRVLYDNVISFGYDIYTSYVAHKKDNVADSND